jgi:GntR family transcriptional repressor for pyruvate dehydrogenase complex
MGEIVAQHLRSKILDGTLADGDLLPTQDELLEEFGVSRASVREALRTLESEGLVRVRRGKIGGATVHAPKAENAAYMLALVLESRHVTIDDVGRARNLIEPICASLCADRPDRHDTVVPALKAVHDEATVHIEDEVRFASLSSRFHELLIEHCGNGTLIAIVGALEALWASDERAFAAGARSSGEFPNLAYRRRRVADHEKIIDLIDAGNAAAVGRAAAKHASGGVLYKDAWAVGRTVSASAIRQPGLG